MAKRLARAGSKETAEAVTPDTGPITALFVGDAHLAERSFAGRHDMVGDPQYAFTQVVDLALKLADESSLLRHVVTAGDLFDSKRPTSGVISFFREQLRRLEKRNIKFAYVDGNHDGCPVSWPKAVYSPAVHLHRRVVEIGGRLIGGLDFTPEDEFETLLEQMPEKMDVLVCHQGWREFATSGGLSIEHHVRRACDVFAGDTHAKSVQTHVGSVPVAISPGSTYTTKSNHDFEHAVFGMTAAGRWHELPIKSRRGLRQPLLTEAEAESFLDNLPQVLSGLFDAELPDDLRRPMIVLTLHDVTLSMKHRLSAALKDKAHVFWTKPVIELQDAPAQDKHVRTEPAGFLSLAEIEFEKKPKTMALLRQLWSSRQPAEVLAALRKDYGK